MPGQRLMFVLAKSMIEKALEQRLRVVVREYKQTISQSRGFFICFTGEDGDMA